MKKRALRALETFRRMVVTGRGSLLGRLVNVCSINVWRNLLGWCESSGGNLVDFISSHSLHRLMLFLWSAGDLAWGGRRHTIHPGGYRLRNQYQLRGKLVSITPSILGKLSDACQHTTVFHGALYPGPEKLKWRSRRTPFLRRLVWRTFFSRTKRFRSWGDHQTNCPQKVMGGESFSSEIVEF